MKTKNKFFVSTFVFILLELTCFDLLSSNKCILGVFYNFKYENLLSLVSSIPFMLFYFYVISFLIIMCFKKIYVNVFSSVWELYKRNILFLVLLSLFTDGIILILSHLFGRKAIAEIICESIFVFVIFAFLIKRSIQKQNNLSRKSKIIIATLLICAVAIITFFLIRYYDYMSIINYYNSKYNNVTDDLFTNIYTKIDLLKMYVSILMHIIAFSIASIVYGKYTYRKNKTNRSIFIFRIFLVLLSFLFYIVVFSIASPCGALYGFKGHGMGPRYSNGPEFFKAEYYNTNFLRKKNYGGYTYYSYQSNKIIIKYGNNIILTYKPLMPIKLTMEEEIANTNSSRYENSIIAYFDNGKPKAILKENISKQEKSDELTKALEELIRSGNFEFLEYGCEYLLKYDSGFIAPYIERYAQGDFNGKEESTNKNIKQSYMISFAQKIKSEYNL